MPLSKDHLLVDSLWEGLTDLHAKTPMSVTADNLAKEWTVNKEQADEYAARSQEKWDTANKAGLFKQEIAPMEVKGKRGAVNVFEVDEVSVCV